MAKKKTTVTTELIPDDAPPAAPENEELDADTFRALTELEGADDISWRVTRLSEPNAGYCGSLSTAELTLDRIALDFGPGHYMVKGIKPNGSYFKSARIKIAKPLKPDAPPPPVATAKPDSGEMMPFLMGMMQQNTAIVTAALSRPEAERKGFPAEAMITALPGLITAVGALFGGRKDPAEQLITAVELVEKLKGEGGGDGKTGSTWVDVLRDALPSAAGAVREALASRAAGAPGAAPSVPAPPAALAGPNAPAVPAPAVAPPTPPAAGQSKFMDVSWLHSQLGYLCEKAQLQRDVGLYVDLLLDEVPAYIGADVLLEHLNRADWWEILSGFDPRVVPHRPWFDTLRRGLIEAVNEQAEQAEQAEQSELAASQLQ